LDAQPWTQLNTGSRIAELMQFFGNFHDGCIREIHLATRHSVDSELSMNVDWRTTIYMLIQRQQRNPSAIELRLEEVVGLNFYPPQPDRESIIFHAACLLREGIFYWADDADWQPESREPGDCAWVTARRAWWRDASDWMGPELRYGYSGSRR
jgi:hypothetical protein